MRKVKAKNHCDFQACVWYYFIVSEGGHMEGKLPKYYLLKNAECSVFLCDRSKFDKTAAYVLGSLSDVDYLVTNPPFTSYPCQPRKKIILTE